MRIKWQIVSKDKQDKPTKWRAEINSERFGKYAWIELITLLPKGKEYIVSIECPERLEVIKCTSLANAKSWIRKHLGGK